MAAKGPEYKGVHDVLWERSQKAARKITWQDGGLRQMHLLPLQWHRT